MTSSLQLYITRDKHLEALHYMWVATQQLTLDAANFLMPHITGVLHDYTSAVSKLSTNYKVYVLI